MFFLDNKTPVCVSNELPIQQGTRFKSPLEQASVTSLVSVPLVSEIQQNIGFSI